LGEVWVCLEEGVSGEINYKLRGFNKFEIDGEKQKIKLRGGSSRKIVYLPETLRKYYDEENKSVYILFEN
jgi:hypothetical protein